MHYVKVRVYHWFPPHLYQNDSNILSFQWEGEIIPVTGLGGDLLLLLIFGFFMRGVRRRIIHA